MTITSKPVITYFETPYLGLGGPIFCLLSDAGIEFEKRTVTHDAWPALKKELVASGKSSHGTVPFMELEGRVYVHQLPILRFLARRLGKYEGSDPESVYFVDSFGDLLADLHQAWGAAYFGKDNVVQTFTEEHVPRYRTSINSYLAKHDGPYLLGDEPTYADFKLLALLHDIKDLSDGSPHMSQFMDAMQARPGVSKYMSTLATPSNQ
ncbi:glutathione S-transferase [Syncephalis pseudoplumigaleata]|uniref:Glutathione S-transferase n=1 Tax=Syncephalis pseudoplumigaleata TaxID=1712513 RepID=A0A4P9YY71_9FUNG|nr:glutathione S-transferase [Syncephalis pseudoplumigaleata]|eukprot:RKP25046.1 glutathione S-transferase [Syncephalis pseudoplumigaleata]